MFLFFFFYLRETLFLSPYLPQELTSLFKLYVPNELKLLKLNQVGKEVIWQALPDSLPAPNLLVLMESTGSIARTLHFSEVGTVASLFSDFSLCLTRPALKELIGRVNTCASNDMI